jgi:membrane protein required for colicin V production
VTVFDYVVLGVVGFSILLSLMRGFIREALGLGGWVIALVAARCYGVQVAGMLPGAIPNENIRMVAGFLVVFLGMLLVTSLLAVGISEVVRKIGLGMLDRGLGLLFGCARGLLIVGVMVLLGGMTSLPQRPEWRDAMFSSPLEAMVLAAVPWLPADMTKHLKFD